MEERQLAEIIGIKIIIWTREGLKFEGKTNWIDEFNVWIADVVSKCERIIPWVAISNIELKPRFER